MAKIVIRCTQRGVAPTSDLISIKSKNLKKLSKKEEKKLRLSLSNNGIIFPFFVWKNKNKTYLLDGQHRLDICNEFGIAEVPVVYVTFSGMDEAQIGALAADSVFAKMTAEGLEGFMKDLDIDSLIPEMNIPGIKAENFAEMMNVDTALLIVLKYNKTKWAKMSEMLSFFRTAGNKISDSWKTDEDIVLGCLKKFVEAN